MIYLGFFKEIEQKKNKKKNQKYKISQITELDGTFTYF